MWNFLLNTFSPDLLSQASAPGLLELSSPGQTQGFMVLKKTLASSLRKEGIK